MIGIIYPYLIFPFIATQSAQPHHQQQPPPSQQNPQQQQQQQNHQQTQNHHQPPTQQQQQQQQLSDSNANNNNQAHQQQQQQQQQLLPHCHQSMQSPTDGSNEDDVWRGHSIAALRRRASELNATTGIPSYLHHAAAAHNSYEHHNSVY